MRKPHTRKEEHGVALVVTVIVVAMLAVIGVAFLQSTSADRASSRSVANYMRAQLAAEAGLGMASSVLARQTTNDTFVIVANTNGQLFVGNGIAFPAGSRDFNYFPLFSSVASASQSNAPITLPPDVLPTATLDSSVVFTNVLPGGLAMTSPPVSWVYLTNSEGQTNARFAFWVEDLSGKLDMSVVGTENTDVAKRPTGTNPAEIALWSLFNPEARSAQDAKEGVAQVNQIISARNAGTLLTPATARVLQNSAVTSEMLGDLAVGLLHDTNEPELIPFGFGYADQGQKKEDLNTLNFDEVRDHLQSNLPNFGTRGGGLSAASYVENISANIFDFVDQGVTPTSGAGYRGVEPLPFLNERMTRFVLSGSPVGDGSGNWVIEIETTEYFEFWNLHNTATPAVTLDFSFTNNQPLIYLGEKNSFGIATNYSLLIPSMPAGAYYVAATPPTTNTFSVASAFPPDAVSDPSAIVCTLEGNSKTVQYSLSASGVLYDRGSGSHYSDKNFRADSLANRTYFSASYPGLGGKVNIGGQNDGDFINSVGDPRATFYMTNASGPLPQIQPSWVEGNTSFGGRTLQSGMGTVRLTKEVKMENWGDGGHNGTAGAKGVGTTPPPLGLFLANQQEYAPARANPNANGRLDRITDLAGIFDPLQWAEAGQSTNWPKEPGAWTNLTSAASANPAYAGGHSLRFGRPEFTRFTNNGTRASQLLDIFTVGSATNIVSDAILNTVPGRINLNTATPGTLRAMAAGVFHTNDPRLDPETGPGGVNFVPPVAAVDAFVAAVTNFRSTTPFVSPSQISLISTDAASWPSSAVFGNRELAGINAANASGAEEWFAKIYPLASVRSRNFVVHAVGQSLGKDAVLSPNSTVRLMRQVYVEPVRDDRGFTTNSFPVLMQSWSL
jgi:hypothetical protein